MQRDKQAFGSGQRGICIIGAALIPEDRARVRFNRLRFRFGRRTRPMIGDVTRIALAVKRVPFEAAISI